MIIEPLNTTMDEPSEMHFPLTNRLVCPICDFEYVHLAAPKVVKSDDYTAWQGRGSAIKIPAQCENGCTFNVCFGFHKGNSFGFVEYSIK